MFSHGFQSPFVFQTALKQPKAQPRPRQKFGQPTVAGLTGQWNQLSIDRINIKVL